MKPFNLERALAGDPVITRDGRTVSELIFFKTAISEQRLYAVIKSDIHAYEDDGKFMEDLVDDLDLFMVEVKKSGWINIYNNGTVGGYYESAEKANEFHCVQYPLRKRVACIKIEWEE